MNRTSDRLLRISIGFFLLLPLLALLHEVLVIVVATRIGALFASEFVQQIARQLLASPVHATIMVETLGGVDAKGVLVTGLPGEILNRFAPGLFIDPHTHTVRPWINSIVDKNSTVLGFYVTQSIVEFITAVVGALILQSGLQKRSLRFVLKEARSFDALRVVIGFFLIAQATVAAFQLTLSPAFAGLRETGIGVGFSLFLQLDQARYNWLMDQVLPLLIPTMLILSALACAWLIGKVLYRLGKNSQPPSLARRVIRKTKLAIALVPVLFLSTMSQPYLGIAGTTLVNSEPKSVAPAPVAIANVELPAPTPTATPTSAPTRAATPTPQAITLRMPTATFIPTATPIRQRRIELQKNGNQFVFVVNGKPTYLTGLNYNVNYTALAGETKRQLHRRDFELMKNAGVNSVIGWGVYDQTTLELAHEFGIGVIMPFELDAKGHYENKSYREQIKNDFRKYVLQYKDAPAVWGWNPGGDELLHRMETEHKRTPDKIQIASDFLVELASLAHSLDPHHVSVVKEPRDWYVPYVEESIRRVRAKKSEPDPSQYFVFAVNTYGKPDGVALVLNTARKSVEERLGVAFAVGEYAPFGLARHERPAHFTAMWRTVRETSSIGGFAYVFGPDQPNPKAPNPYDPLRLLVSEFSLVDIEGKPVDGSWDALSHYWRMNTTNHSFQTLDAK